MTGTWFEDDVKYRFTCKLDEKKSKNNPCDS